MIGKPLTPGFAQEVAAEVSKECDPGSDNHVSSRFRRNLAGTLLARVLLEALEDSMLNGVSK
jgi:CO/xanthine dehydrogenase FAD-binding subunit